jgi:2-methylisocitrate lyase-like PEP mutase family enzyme
MFQHLGFSAIAATCAGFAWFMGRPDYALNRADVMDHLRTLSSSVDLPEKADF